MGGAPRQRANPAPRATCRIRTDDLRFTKALHYHCAKVARDQQTIETFGRAKGIAPAWREQRPTRRVQLGAGVAAWLGCAPRRLCTRHPACGLRLDGSP